MCITRTPPRVTTKPAAAWRGLCKGVYVLPGYTIAGEQAAGSGTKGLSVHPCTRSNLGSALQELRRKHIRPPRTTDFKCRPAVDVARASLSRAWLPGSRPSPHPCTMPVVSTALGAPQAWQEMAQPAQRTAQRTGATAQATAQRRRIHGVIRENGEDMRERKIWHIRKIIKVPTCARQINAPAATVPHCHCSRTL